MKILSTYKGIESFGVKIDECPELDRLAAKARKLRKLPFPERLEAVTQLAVNAMINAYEQMQTNPNPRKRELCEDIVVNPHSLGFALENRAGCCRYQGALFFALGYEADLGDTHFIQAAPVRKGLNSVFNEVYERENRHIVSIFLRSLKDKSMDYSRQNPDVFNQAHEKIADFQRFSYHRTPEGLIIVSNPEVHVKELNPQGDKK